MLNKLPNIENKKFWLTLIIGVKLVLLVFFYYEVIRLGYEENDGLFVKTGDTFSYYAPMRSFLDGTGSLDACRMPAFVPLYALPYWVFGESFANNFIILIQIIMSILSVYLLGKISNKVSKSQLIGKLTILIYTISTFTFLYDIFAIADSLSISTLIIGVYFLFEYWENEKIKPLIISGFFFAWSVFFRQIGIIPLGLLGVYLLIRLIRNKELLKKISHPIMFGLPLILMLSSWTLYNKVSHDRFIPLVKPVHECYSGYPEHQFDLLDLPIAWGGIFTKWNGEGEWFTNPKMKKSDFPFKNVETSEYTIDSLENLRQLHFTYFDKSKTSEEKEQIANEVSRKSIEYRNAYKKEYPLRYYIVNPLILLKKFLFPKTIEKLPLPPVEEMNLFEKAFKAFYMVLFWLVNLFALLGILNPKINSTTLLLVAGGIISFLTFYFGWVEQRYFAPVYPFMVIFASISLFLILERIKGFKSKV